MLIASALCSLSDTMMLAVNVIAVPQAAFSSNAACGLTAGFANNSNGATSYAWNFGDGNSSAQTSPSHTYNTGGTYIVTMIATNAAGCSDTVQQQVTVNPAPVSAFGFAAASCGLNVSFQNTSSNASSYLWSFGDGAVSSSNDPLHLYPDSGMFIVMLIADPGPCADTSFQSVTLHIPPVAVFSSTPGCNLHADFVSNTSGAISYHWDFGDGATASSSFASHTYSQDGNYTVTLIATDQYGCSDTVVNQVNIDPVPVAAFSSSTLQCSLDASFQNNSLNANAVLWLFGDGSSSAANDPSHTYADTGTYNVMLIVNPGQCADTMTHTVTVHTSPAAQFSQLPQCDLTCVFVNNSTGGDSYSWDFGDAQTSNILSPTHVYSMDGSYTVTLIVENVFGCSDTLFQQVQIAPMPVSSFSFTPPVCTMQVDFQNTSQDATAFIWNFGDGVTTPGNDVSHQYSIAGTFPVSLISISGNCSDTSTQQVTVNTLPTSGFSFNPDCDLLIHLLNASINSTSYQWDFGDQNISTDPSPSHTYVDAGSYLITLTSNDQNGCQDSTQQLITIYENPVSLFSYDPVYCVLNVPFQNSSSNASSYLWDFGDGTTSNETSPAHLFPHSGSFNVSLTTNPGGCADQMVQMLTVSLPPVAEFESEGNCSFAVVFQNESDSASLYSWNFGDGNYSSDSSAAHMFSTIGSHEVTLIAMKPDGCADTVVHPVNVVVYAPATYVPEYDTCLTEATFKSTSINAGTYDWNFGDGTTSQDAETAHQYNYAGEFGITLITNKGTACADTLNETFFAAPPPEHGFYIPNCFTPNGDGLNDDFSVIDFGSCHVYHLVIFNRWGEVVFETDNLNDKWDGRFKGTLVPEDVYAYLLDGKDYQKQGSVLVLK